MNLVPSTSTRVWSSYVAIGDSFTEGMSDPDPENDNAFIGWADRLAESLSELAQLEKVPFQYANLAVRGRLLSDIVGPQLDRALEMSPDLVSLVGGGNDLLRPNVDTNRIMETLEAAVVRLRQSGADVLLATPVDPQEAGLLKPLRGRHAIHAANIFTLAHRHGCYVLNLWGMPALRDWRLWADDRIHLTTEGHRRVALAALTSLGHATDEEDWRTPLPAADAATKRQELRAHAAWTRQHLAPWVQRRMKGQSSGDHVDPKRPELSPMRPFVDGP